VTIEELQMSVVKMEGGVVNLPKAQTDEVIRCVFTVIGGELAACSDFIETLEVLQPLADYAKRCHADLIAKVSC
jgi:hypothetical protein